ncbi:C-C motif chemokine 5-like [Ascaphus truei]|uniref:C-C motif chemokine 5-like n=1 Tax=Ascaphus truei TaxID=8439 RepID=UPI003F5A4C33
MKASLVTLSILLSLAFYNEVHSGPVGSDVISCCFAYTGQKIPRKHVTDYFYTSARCSKPAVVFITRKNRKMCADPTVNWVKDHVHFLEMKATAK